MDNIDFLVEVLQSKYEYWVVAKKNEYRQFMEFKRGKDNIILTAIPLDIPREKKRDKILLSELENLNNINMPNIFLNDDCPPFQLGITLRNIYMGFPIKSNVKKIMIKLLKLDSNDIYDYKKIIEENSTWI